MKKKTLLTFLSAILLSSLCALTVTACVEEYKPFKEIPGIKENAVLHIENNRLSFAKDMELDEADIIARCGCMLVNDDGSEVKITAQNIIEGSVTYEKFDLSTVGTGKQVKVAYKQAENYIVYDVNEYTVNYYLDEAKTALWKSAPASSAITGDLGLSVWIDIENNNYSVDADAVTLDTDRALRFNGWYNDDGEPVTGLKVQEAPSSGNVRVTDLCAKYITPQQLAVMDISYKAGRRVFSGYSGAEVETLVVPEGVTYVDFASIFKSSPAATKINFTKLSLPSTARVDVPLKSGINTAGLTDVSVDAGNRYYSSYNGALYSKDYSVLYFMPASSLNVSFHDSMTEFASYSCSYWQISTLGIPDNVTTLQHYCFAYSNLSNVDGFENVQTIMTGVFYGTALSIDNGVALYTAVPDTGSGVKYDLSMIIDKTITEYTVMDGTVGIAGDAFYGCKNLVSVNLGGEVESIGNSAFSGCVSLKEINLTSSLKYLGNAVFYGCKALTTVTGLPDVTYSQERQIIEHTLPDELFYQCESLNSVTLPEGLLSIGNSSFYGCSSLTEITLPQTLQRIGASAFHSCGITELKLPASVNTVSERAFSHSDLVSIDLSECTSLNKLSARCFEYTKLESIDIPDRVTAIPDYCFYYVRTLAEVSLKNVTSIGVRAFSYCTALTDIDWGKTQTIAERAFSNCTSLTEVVLSDEVVSVGSYAFQACNGLKKLTLGARVASFGTYTFTADGKNFDVSAPVLYQCRGLKEITVAEGNPNFISVDGVLYGKTVAGKDCGEGGVLFAVPCGYEQTSLVLPEAVKIILPYSVHYQANLTGITLNEGLENIGKGAFYYSTKLTSLAVPSTVTTLGASVLLNCTAVTEFTISEENQVYSTDGNLIYENGGTSLAMYIGLSDEVEIREGTLTVEMGVFMNNAKITSLVIPDSVKEIGVKAFNGCSNLKSIVIGGGLKTIDSTSFAALSSLETITVSEDNKYFKAVNNVLYSKDGAKLLLCAAKNGLTALEIEKGVTEISDWAFSYHATLKGVTLPSGVKKVGDYAFYECRELEYFYGSQELETIGAYALSFATSINPDDTAETRRCDTLKEVLLYENTAYLGDYAFYGQYGIERVFFKMTAEEVSALLSASGKNYTYLTRGCPIGATGEHYNEISRYLFIATEPNELTINYDGYGWFRLDENNLPKVW